ncbi:MAG: hypothetical protein V9E84_00770 [Trichococcus flocculiformis]
MLEAIGAEEKISAIVKGKIEAFHNPEKTVAGQMVIAVGRGRGQSDLGYIFG